MVTATTQTTTSVTSMLPRVVFEYGQTWCAAFTNACSCSRGSPGTEISSALSARSRRDRPDPHRAGDTRVRGQRDLLLPATTLSGAQKAGRVTRSEELSAFAPVPPAPPSSRGVASATSSAWSHETAHRHGR